MKKTIITVETSRKSFDFDKRPIEPIIIKDELTIIYNLPLEKALDRFYVSDDRLIGKFLKANEVEVITWFDRIINFFKR